MAGETKRSKPAGRFHSLFWVCYTQLPGAFAYALLVDVFLNVLGLASHAGIVRAFGILFGVFSVLGAYAKLRSMSDFSHREATAISAALGVATYVLWWTKVVDDPAWTGFALAGILLVVGGRHGDGGLPGPIEDAGSALSWRFSRHRGMPVDHKRRTSPTSGSASGWRWFAPEVVWLGAIRSFSPLFGGAPLVIEARCAATELCT